MDKKSSLLSVKQAAKIVGFTPCHLRVLIRSGKVKAQMIGTEYLIEKDDLKNVTRKRIDKEL